MQFLPSLFLFKIALKILLDKVLKTKLSLLIDKKYLVYKALFSYPEYKKKIFSCLFCRKKTKDGKWPFLDKKHGLTPLENFEFFHFFKTLFILSRKHSILSRIMPNSFLSYFAKKTNMEYRHFLPNTTDKPLWKLNFEFLHFLQTSFFLCRKHSFLSRIWQKRPKK